jgi:integrase
MDKTSRIEKSKAYRNDKYVKSWLVGLKERTQINYLEGFADWYAFMGMTPTQMIEKRLKDTRSDNMAERMFFEQKFREYKQHLEDLGTLSAIAVKTQLIPVASFFSRNGLPLNLKRGDWESNQVQKAKTTKLKITKEEIKAMYTHGGTRDRALLLVLAQSGFSEVDVSSFRIEDLRGLYTAPETEHFFLEKPREKTHETQATCFGYEAVHDLKAWLQERGNPQEGYLFISTTKAKGNQLDMRAISDAMKALATKAFGKEKGKKFKTKALRSFHNSALLRANIQPQELKDVMMGHKRLGARGHYAYDEQTIRENYTKAFEHMSINGIQTRTDIAKLKEEVNKNKVQFADMLAEHKAKFEKEIAGVHKYVEKNLDLVLGLFNEIAATDEGKALLKKIQEERQEKALTRHRQAEQEE